MKAVNPATGQPIRDYPEHDESEVASRLERAEQAFASWRKTPFAERARLMRTAGDLLRDRAGDYGRLITEEMGKPIAAAEGEVDKCAWVCEFYAENAERFLSAEPVGTDASRSWSGGRKGVGWEGAGEPLREGRECGRHRVNRHRGTSFGPPLPLLGGHL